MSEVPLYLEGAEGEAAVGVPFLAPALQRELFIDNLLVRIHFIIVMIRWTGLAPARRGSLSYRRVFGGIGVWAICPR